MPLPLTISCSSKIQIGFTFLVSADPGSPGQRAVKRVCGGTAEKTNKDNSSISLIPIMSKGTLQGELCSNMIDFNWGELANIG